MKLLSLLLALLVCLTGCAASVAPEPEPVSVPASVAPDGDFTVYFLDVGQADSALVLCDGEAMLIDGGNAADSDFIYSFLKNHDIGHLSYIVATHAHEDHVGGLPGALNAATVDIALSPVTEHDSGVFESFVKYLDKQNVSITVPSPGDVYTLGSATFEVIGPVREYDDPNNTSIVLKITYGDTSFLFTGDTERDAEQDILDAGADLSATVLKVGHHGSESSTSYPFLREVMPKYAVISCGKDNSYGHPHDEALSRLRDAAVTLFRTDLQGTVTCVSDGETVSFATERGEGTVTNPTTPASSKGSAEDTTATYIGNINSHVFHTPNCPNLPAEHNRVVLASRDEAVNAGYTPCGNCKP